MSNPLYWPVVGSWTPSPGWSFFTPIRTRPVCCIFAKVGEPGTVTFAATGEDNCSLGAAPGAPSRPQAAPNSRAARARTTPTTRACLMIVNAPSVGEDLAEEVARPGGGGAAEEGVGRGVLDDLAVGHEHHA